MKRKKICILQNGLAYGGTDTFVINLATRINPEKYTVDFVVSGNDDVVLRTLFIEKFNGRVFRTCGLNGIKGRINHLRKLYKILKSEKYDVFQTNIDLFNGPNLLVAWMARVPIRVCHSHNSEQGRELKEGRNIKIKLYQGVMRWLCWTFSNRRCGCSKLAMDFLYKDKWNRDKKSKIIHNGIELGQYLRKIDVKSKKIELGMSNRYHIVTVGRIAFQKNPIFITNIFNELCKIRDDCDLVWVGTGEMLEEVKSKFEEYAIEDRVHFLGTRSDVNEILPVCNLFLLPSRFEGLGIVLIEAQAAGLPCVVSNTIPVEANCGGCYCMGLDRNPLEWAKKVDEILDGRIQLFVSESRINEYDVSFMVKEMEEVFE